MNEEEKKAIKELQNKHIFFSEYEAIEDYETKNNINTILNLVEKQQKEIEELKGKNKELFEEYNKRVSTIIDYEQGLKEIIDEEDDPDTWAYHAVKKLLEEVGGIEYE